MAKTTEQIKQELGITNETSLNDMIEMLNSIEVVSQENINNIKAISVLPLPNNVKDKAEELKQRFVNIVLDENKGVVYLMNLRSVLMTEICKQLSATNSPYDRATLKSLVLEIMNELYPDISEVEI